MNYPGYPAERFRSTETTTIPDGPWQMNNSPFPTAEQTQAFQTRHLETDDFGRPLHPNIQQMLAKGALAGRGAYWNWGPNYTVDPIVITDEEEPHVLLIQRSDTKKWALPGGFVDADEDTHVAALRELDEETGLTLDTQGKLIYQGPVEDLRTTAHAWADTSAYLFTVPQQLPVQAADDALNAEWRPLRLLDDNDNGTLHGSHLTLIKLALLKHYLKNGD